MPMTTRFFTARVDQAALRSQKILTDDARSEYLAEMRDVAEWWGGKIRASGRGGSHNAQMSNIETAITTTGSGKFFMRVGWLGSPPMAADGKTTWFVYQDTGYHMFGGSHFVPGLMLQLDARQRLAEGIRDANKRLAARVEREWR